MASKKSRKVHVTFGDSKRIMSYEKGVEVKELRSLFVSEFSDVLADDISPANVKFQVFHTTFKDYVDLKNDQHLEENAQIKAITVGTKEKQVSFGVTVMTLLRANSLTMQLIMHDDVLTIGRTKRVSGGRGGGWMCMPTHPRRFFQSLKTWFTLRGCTFH